MWNPSSLYPVSVPPWPWNNPMPVLILLPFIIALMLIFQTRKPTKESDDGWFESLLVSETFFLDDHPSPGVESVFQCEDIVKTIAYLEQRVRDIIAKNPWTMGRLKRRGWFRLGKVWVPREKDHAETNGSKNSSKGSTFFQVLHIDDLACRPQDCDVARGAQSYDKDEPLVKLRLLVPHRFSQDTDRGHDSDRVVLVLSMSHMIADASSVYQLWGMLNPGNPIRSLQFKRLLSVFPFHALSRNGLLKILWWFYHCDFGVVQKILFGADPFSETPRLHTCRYVKKTWISEQKAKHIPSDRVPFVSSHDLLASWFFQQFPHCCAGSTAINMRGRSRHHPQLNQDYVGNYASVLIFTKADYQSPTDIRLAVDARGSSTGIGRTSSRRCGMITAWHSYYQHVDLPYCHHIIHSVSKRMFPPATITSNGTNDETNRSDQETKTIHSNSSWISSSPATASASTLPPVPDTPFLVIFNASPDQLAVLCITKEPLRDDAPLGDVVVGWD